MRERTRFPAALLHLLPALKLLVTTGMANASIDLAAARSRGVTVWGTGGSRWAAPELSWGLIMAVTRNIPQEDALVRAGGWQAAVGRELAGATLGLLGLGRIGQRMAQYARAFDMDVIAWSQHLTGERPGVRRTAGYQGRPFRQGRHCVHPRQPLRADSWSRRGG